MRNMLSQTATSVRCKTEICRDTNAALNILKKGMNLLGVEWNEIKGTEGHSGTSGEPGTLEESSTAVDERKLDSISCLDESRITVCENPAL